MNRFRTGYRLGSAEVVLDCDDERASAWAQEFLPPFISAVPPKELSPSATVVSASFTNAASPLPCSVDASSSVQMFLGRRGCRRRTADFDEITDCASGDVFRVSTGSVLARYVADSPYFLRDPARIVREVLINTLVGRGALRVHGAAAASGGQAVLVVGRGGAGKSSTVAQLLAAGGQFIANDRALLVRDEDTLQIVGVPLAVRWSEAQLGFVEGGTHFVRGYDEASKLQRWQDVGGYRKFELTPNEVADLSGRPPAPSARLRAVVIANRGAVGEALLEPLDPEAGARAVDQEVLLTDPAFPSFFELSARTHESWAHLLAAEPGIRWFRLTGSFQDASASRTILQALACDRPLADSYDRQV